MWKNIVFAHVCNKNFVFAHFCGKKLYLHIFATKILYLHIFARKHFFSHIFILYWSSDGEQVLSCVRRYLLWYYLLFTMMQQDGIYVELRYLRQTSPAASSCRALRNSKMRSNAYSVKPDQSTICNFYILSGKTSNWIGVTQIFHICPYSHIFISTYHQKL